ncbi:hypothetical protein [Streptacidiphilus sp. MAP5-52]|uniref:hypothetical protein n=1 Tax=Streptacidiphilus sp. MAP5-52 TaxID=3156267 RepID=UPI0035119F73
MLQGVLIAESLREGTELADVPLTVIKITRLAVDTIAPGQPRTWTLMEFTAAESDAAVLAEQLAASLSTTGGWYVDFHTQAESFVVFPNRIFRHPRGDADGRRRAQDHGRQIGIPEAQLDWKD